MLTDDLQTLIKELEEEKVNLLRLIEEAVKEQEYLNAYFHSEALEQLNRQLLTVKSFDDELYVEKYDIQIGIDNLRKRLSTETSDKLKSMLVRVIAEKERELANLHQRPKEPGFKNDSHLLENYLDLLFTKKIKGLRIVISKPDNLQVEIRRTANGIKLTIPNIRKLEKKNVLSEERYIKLKGLGFTLNDRGERLMANFQNEKNSLAQKMETVLSIMVFEVFYFKEVGEGASIEVWG